MSFQIWESIYQSNKCDTDSLCTNVASVQVLVDIVAYYDLKTGIRQHLVADAEDTVNQISAKAFWCVSYKKKIESKKYIHTKVNFSVSLERTGRVAQKKKSVKKKTISKHLWRQVFVSGEESSTGRDVKQILVDDSLLFFLLSLSLSLPLDWDLNGSLSEIWLSGCMAVCAPELSACTDVSIKLGLHCRCPRGEGRWGLPWCQFLL